MDTIISTYIYIYRDSIFKGWGVVRGGRCTMYKHIFIEYIHTRPGGPGFHFPLGTFWWVLCSFTRGVYVSICAHQSFYQLAGAWTPLRFASFPRCFVAKYPNPAQLLVLQNQPVEGVFPERGERRAIKSLDASTDLEAVVGFFSPFDPLSGI